MTCPLCERKMPDELHVVTDDLNVEDESVEWCMSDKCHEVFGRPPTPAEVACWEALRAATPDERISALRWDRRQ